MPACWRTASMMRSETSVLLTTSENDFTYRNYAKKDFVLGSPKSLP